MLLHNKSVIKIISKSTLLHDKNVIKIISKSTIVVPYNYEIIDNLLLVYFVSFLVDKVHTTKSHYRIKSSNIRHSTFSLCKKKKSHLFPNKSYYDIFLASDIFYFENAQ